MHDLFVNHFDLIGLFFNAFVSATLAPGGSEILLFYLLHQNQNPAWLLWLMATTGNTLGGMTSFALGYLISKGYRSTEAIFTDKNQKLLVCIEKWGLPVLLFSWLPVVGDVFCLLAGWLRLSSMGSFAMILSGKGIRYALIMFLEQSI